MLDEIDGRERGSLPAGAPETPPSLALMETLGAEIARQAALHPQGFPATRDGIRLALADADDELRESLEAWRVGRCKCAVVQCDHGDWTAVAEEMTQAAAILMAAVRSIRDRDARREETHGEVG